MCSLPTGRREAPPTADRPIAINGSLHCSLTKINEGSKGLYSLWEEAYSLTHENVLTEEVGLIHDNCTHAYNIHMISSLYIVSAQKAQGL